MQEKIKIKAGHLLISEPFLPDPNFSRAVILLTEYREDGSMGFILNRETDYYVDDVLDDFPDLQSPVCIGGPVDLNSLHYLHSLGEKLEGSIKLVPGLYWGGDFDQLKALVISGKVKPHQIKFFAGYSGWGEQQLEDELAHESWITMNAKKNHVLGNTKGLWKKVLSEMGGKFSQMANYPLDPTLN